MKKHIKINWREKYLEIYGITKNKFSYDISFQHLLGDGLEKWLRHLSEKNWWGEELKVAFTKAFNEINSYGEN